MIIRKVVIFLLLLSGFAFSQTDSEIVQKARGLMAVKKYNSAYKLLDDFDRKNQKPDIVLLKEDIALNYFVASSMHKMFAFKDLKANEEFSDYRGKKGSFQMYSFPVDEVLESLIKKYPGNYKLYNGLGRYYYEVHLNYADRWDKSTDDLLRLMELNYTKAVNNHAGDYLSYYVLGYVNISKEKYKEGIPYFLKSIRMDTLFVSSYYNLALAYWHVDDTKNALKYAKKSLDMYQDKTYKADAARMIGSIYAGLKDDVHAVQFYEESNKIDPKNYYTVKYLLSLYVKHNNPKADRLRGEFFALDLKNPAIYNDLADIYQENKKTMELIGYFKKQISVYQTDLRIVGNLHFYLGRLYFGSKENKLAKESFLKAKDCFGRVFDKNNKVFQEIDKMLKRIK